MAKKKNDAATAATLALSRAKIEFQVHRYEHDPEEHHFGDETAAALGVDPRRLFKTLVTSCDDRLVVGIVPVAGQLDLKALAATVGAKRAALAEPAAAQRATGYVVGGISPLGQRTALPTVLDASALEWDTILVSGGRRGMQVELAAADLVRLLSASVAPIGR